LLASEEFVNQCQKWLRQQKPEFRLSKELKNYIEETVFPKMTGYIKKDTISEETCRKYMHIWGYKYDEKRKDVFYDGHERPDVVQYRKEWLKRMFNYKQLMKDYNGEMLDEIIEPQLQPDEKEHVIITHDESHFYANEGQKKLWIQDGEDILRPKYQGRSIMVSDFLCACHGSLQLTDEQLKANPHVKFKDVRVLQSIQADGYWKAEHMIEQVSNGN